MFDFKKMSKCIEEYNHPDRIIGNMNKLTSSNTYLNDLVDVYTCKAPPEKLLDDFYKYNQKTKPKSELKNKIFVSDLDRGMSAESVKVLIFLI